jgi:hypothetical protein
MGAAEALDLRLVRRSLQLALGEDCDEVEQGPR